MTARHLKDLVPEDPIVWIHPLYPSSLLWRTEGHVISVNPERVTCEFLIDQMRTLEFFTDTGLDVLGPRYGWAEIPGLGAKSTKHTRLDRRNIVELLWQAKRAFASDNKRGQQDTLDTLVDGIQGMTPRRRPTNGPVYYRMKLVEALYYGKAPTGAMNDLPDIFIDYMTLS
ncbi:hypothetical protein A2333_01915 [Candidatus Wolfebacteria bacterium RIFOXYB2_FULL_49_7]|nr:MAG: hypothetical protein A2333_01915 [Candidatus Wolfebacteria bacterium RIFOXYB2_FULL_49_7]